MDSMHLCISRFAISFEILEHNIQNASEIYHSHEDTALDISRLSSERNPNHKRIEMKLELKFSIN